MQKSQPNSEADQVRESILATSSSRQVEIASDLLAYDWEHKWLEGGWLDATVDGEITFSGLQYDDGSALVAFVLKQEGKSGSHPLGSVLASFQPEEFDSIREELHRHSPPDWLLDIWLEQVRASA